MDDRFESALEMRKSLEGILENMAQEEKNEVIMFPKADGKTENDKPLADEISSVEESAGEEETHDYSTEDSVDGREIEDNIGIGLIDDEEDEEDIEKSPLNRTVSLFGSALGTNKFVNERGNSSGNIVNGGIAAHQGFWVYYSNVGRGIFRAKPDGSDSKILCEDSAWFINVIGNWIYYSNASDDDRLYRIRV